jgi:hypothetical protein
MNNNIFSEEDIIQLHDKYGDDFARLDLNPKDGLFKGENKTPYIYLEVRSIEGNYVKYPKFSFNGQIICATGLTRGKQKGSTVEDKYFNLFFRKYTEEEICAIPDYRKKKELYIKNNESMCLAKDYLDKAVRKAIDVQLITAEKKVLNIKNKELITFNKSKYLDEQKNEVQLTNTCLCIRVSFNEYKTIGRVAKDKKTVIPVVYMLVKENDGKGKIKYESVPAFLINKEGIEEPIGIKNYKDLFTQHSLCSFTCAFVMTYTPMTGISASLNVNKITIKSISNSESRVNDKKQAETLANMLDDEDETPSFNVEEPNINKIEQKENSIKAIELDSRLNEEALDELDKSYKNLNTKQESTSGLTQVKEEPKKEYSKPESSKKSNKEYIPEIETSEPEENVDFTKHEEEGSDEDVKSKPVKRTIKTRSKK